MDNAKILKSQTSVVYIRKSMDLLDYYSKYIFVQSPLYMVPPANLVSAQVPDLQEVSKGRRGRMSTVSGESFHEKFKNFNIIQATYKIVHGHNIRADVLIPKSLSGSGPRPVIARFHGGGLTIGDSLFADWTPLWQLELAETYNAIIVSANYRFLPEATGLEVLDDVDDFWSWLHSDRLKALLAAHSIELDLDRVISGGDSAGGLLSVYLALSYRDQLRAGTASYPSRHWDDQPLYSPTKSALISEVPESIIDEYTANIKPGDVESSDPLVKRLDLSSAISQHRRGLGFYIRDSEAWQRQQRLFQLQRLGLPDAKLPRGGLVIVHGVDDDVVVAQASERFVAKARETLKGRQGGDKIVLSLRPGGHGFDVDISLKEKWLGDALEAAVKAWLR